VSGAAENQTEKQTSQQIEKLLDESKRDISLRQVIRSLRAPGVNAPVRPEALLA
jgi:hypothetical protein